MSWFNNMYKIKLKNEKIINQDLRSQLEDSKDKTKKLLKKQQETSAKLQTTLSKNNGLDISKFNTMLEKSQDALLCGPDCQKAKNVKKFQDKYINAQSNLLTAPASLDIAKEKYYVYKESQSYYDNMKEKDLNYITTI